MLVDEQTLPSLSDPSEAGRGGVTQPCREAGLLKLIYTPTLFVYDRAAVHVIPDFTATGIWPTQTESEDGSEIGDADMPDLVWDH